MPYSNVTLVLKPLALPVPFKVALVAVTLVAAEIDTVGGVAPQAPMTALRSAPLVGPTELVARTRKCTVVPHCAATVADTAVAAAFASTVPGVAAMVLP